eukprot:6192671-Pleurochrysis_carterae.AAC.1
MALYDVCSSRFISYQHEECLDSIIPWGRNWVNYGIGARFFLFPEDTQRQCCLQGVEGQKHKA